MPIKPHRPGRFWPAVRAMLDGYIRPSRLNEVSYREILLHIKEMRVPLSTPDVADLAAQYLRDKGVKVWR